MSKEAKYTIYFLSFLCLLVSAVGMLSGCKSKGYQGIVYHDKDLIAKTSCDDELFLNVGPDTIVVKSLYIGSYGITTDREVYKYVNDGHYRVEKKVCER